MAEDRDTEARWYVVHTYSGYENKVAQNLETIVENRRLQELIHEVKVPVELVPDIKDGKEREVERKLFPGYVLVKMVMTDDSWYIVRNTRGVTGFVGPSSKPIPLTDEYGTLDVYLLPFLKPAMVRHVWPDEPVESYNDALACVLRHCPPDPAHRSVLVAHQFVAGAACCESEEVSVGGVDSVDTSLFDAFDYVALGHLHSPQKVGRDAVRYCGTPLKYSFSEADQHKSATFVEFGLKGEVSITTAPLTPKHDLREVRGSYMELTDRRNYDGTAVDDYLHITLTDEQDVPDALARLRVIYPNLMRLDYDNLRTREDQEITAPERAESITPLEHFSAFYQLQNNQPLTAEQAAFCQQLIEEIWKEGEDA